MLLDYRLNEVDEARREAIDARLITDADFAAAMQEAEYDLLDAYAANELTTEKRRRVERALHPQGRYSPASAGHVIGLQEPPRELARASLSVTQRRPFWWLSAAAVLLAGGVSAWFLHRHQAPANPAIVRQSAPPVSAPPVARPESTMAPSPPDANAKIPAAKPNQRSTSALVILASALRSGDALPLSIGPEVKTVHFVWPPAGERAGSQRYELQVVREDGEVSCRSLAGPLQGTRSLGFSCPAASLPTGSAFVRIVELPFSSDAAPIFELTLAVARR